MTKKPILNQTSSTHAKSPKRQTIERATKKNSSAASLTVRPKAKRRRPPQQSTQKQLEMTLAAAKARDAINDYYDDIYTEPGSPEHRECLRFLAKYFGQRGVQVNSKGTVTFPRGACGEVKFEDLLANAYLLAEDFFTAVDYELGTWFMERYLGEITDMGWRQGFIATPTLVPLIVGLNLDTMTLEINSRADRKSTPQNDAMSPLERAFAAQLPVFWESWKAKRKAGLKGL